MTGMTEAEQLAVIVAERADGVALLRPDYHAALVNRGRNRTLTAGDIERISARLQAEEQSRLKMIALRRTAPGRGGEKVVLVQEQASDANERAKVYRNVASDPVELLFSRKSLSPRQYEAAQRLRGDLELAETTVRAANYAGRVSGGETAGELSDARLDAISRSTRCLAQLGRIGAALVRAIVCDCRPVRETGDRLGFNKNYTAPRLAEALDIVADFYRL